MTDKRKDEMEDDIKRAREILHRLCSGKGHDVSWRMSIPVHQDDSDMVLSRVIDRAESPPVPDDVASAIETVNYVMTSIDGVNGKTFRMGSPQTFKNALATLIRAATTPSTPTVSEEDKARALRALETIANQKTSKEWEEEGDTEYAYDFIINLVRDALFTIRTLLLPTPRGEG